MAAGLSRSLPAAFSLSRYRLFTGKPAGFLHDSDAFDLGGRQLRVIDTPGHSPGHVCPLDKARGYLFSGDFIYGGAPIDAFYPATDPDQLARSLKKIARFAPRVNKIYPGYYALGRGTDVLSDAGHWADALSLQHLDHFGSEIHSIGQLSVHF